MIDLAVLLGVFLFGVAAGFVLLLRVACAQEGRTVRAEPPGPVAAAARRMAGLYVRAPTNQDGPGDESQ